MTEESGPHHAGLPVHGYKEQPQYRVDLVNNNKQIEELTLRTLDRLRELGPDIDQRWLAVGRTHIEQAWMAINRSIFQPQRFDMPSPPPGDRQRTPEEMLENVKAYVDPSTGKST